jgi:hypothetical protein
MKEILRRTVRRRTIRRPRHATQGASYAAREAHPIVAGAIALFAYAPLHELDHDAV